MTLLQGDQLKRRAQDLGVSFDKSYTQSGNLLESVIQQRVIDAERDLRERLPSLLETDAREFDMLQNEMLTSISNKLFPLGKRMKEFLSSHSGLLIDPSLDRLNKKLQHPAFLIGEEVVVPGFDFDSFLEVVRNARLIATRVSKMNQKSVKAKANRSSRSRKITVFETAFNRYTTSKVLGEGGAGRVYEATDDSGNVWAVKLLDPKSATVERRKRFKNEIIFSETTKHPNIVQITDRGIAELSEGKTPFYVMARYSASLRNRMSVFGDGSQRLRYFDQILNGVQVAHLKGVLHRDLKPENILFDEKMDNFVVADFGIAHFTDEELYTAAETKPHTRLANFLYAAPEQKVRGQAVEAPADIYALGLILNELFTGHIPHGTKYKTIKESFPDYAWLDDLVDAMLSQQPDRRPVSIDEVKKMLIAHQQDYVTRQHLDELSKTVVPTTAITDPLAESPPTIIGFDYSNGILKLILSKPINEKWVRALINMGNYKSLLHKGPEYFTFSGDLAQVTAEENEVQAIIDYFKEWLPKATAKYRELIETEKRTMEEAKRTRIGTEQEELERLQRLRKTIKL